VRHFRCPRTYERFNWIGLVNNNSVESTVFPHHYFTFMNTLGFLLRERLTTRHAMSSQTRDSIRIHSVSSLVEEKTVIELCSDYKSYGETVCK
jgi:hypothetical protein